MPKVRFRLPFEIEVTEKELESLEALGELARKVRSSGIPEALSDAFQKTAAAASGLKHRRKPHD